MTGYEFSELTRFIAQANEALTDISFQQPDMPQRIGRAAAYVSLASDMIRRIARELPDIEIEQPATTE